MDLIDGVSIVKKLENGSPICRCLYHRTSVKMGQNKKMSHKMSQTLPNVQNVSKKSAKCKKINQYFLPEKHVPFRYIPNTEKYSRE